MPAIRRGRIAGEKKLAPTTSCSSILEEIILQKWKRTFGAFLFLSADELSFIKAKGSRKRLLPISEGHTDRVGYSSVIPTKVA